MKRAFQLYSILLIFTFIIAGCSGEGNRITGTSTGGYDLPGIEGNRSSILEGEGHEISGRIFIDANVDGIRNPAEETCISAVTVTLIDGQDGRWTAVSDRNGYYAFLMPPGTYTLMVEEASEATDDFNETLAASFDPTTPAALEVTVGPNSYDNDFGFDPRTEELTQALELGTVETTGESPKFWCRQLREAIKEERKRHQCGNRGHWRSKAQYDADTMAGFIAEIQELFLPVPFQFEPGREFQQALAIMRGGCNDPLKKLMRELLAAEFNHVSGRGMVGAFELQGVMLAWAESVAVEASSEVETEQAVSKGLPPAAGGSLLDEAISFLVQLNMSIGGGSGGGG